MRYFAPSYHRPRYDLPLPQLTTDNLLFYGTAAVLAMLFIYLWRRKELLSVFTGGRWWLTWMAIAILTLMDELTSIFYLSLIHISEPTRPY